MSFVSNILSKSAVGALAIGMGLASSASALTIDFNSSGGASLSITDGGFGDLDGVVDGVILVGGHTIGGFNLLGGNAAASDTMNLSELTQTALQFSGGLAGETLTVTTSAAFSGAAAGPNPSGLRYSLGGSELGGTLSGYGTAGGTSTATLSFDPLIDGIASFSGDTSTTAVLSDPFQITSNVILGEIGTDKTSFTSTVVAAVPVPAGGLLLLTALGGVAALRRKRKKAA